MNFGFEEIVIIVGNYGSGKTEIAINLAIDQKCKGVDVRVADLDLVNPYFRTREARQTLNDHGIDLVLPPKQYLQADLPILDAKVGGMIRNPAQLTILDVGGEDVGATVLSALADFFTGRTYQMLQVVNPFRPKTDTVQGCLEIRNQIEHASKLKVTGVVGNANLINETGIEDVMAGYEFAVQVARAAAVDLVFVTVPASLAERIDPRKFKCPLLEISRQLVPPWEKAGPI